MKKRKPRSAIECWWDEAGELAARRAPEIDREVAELDRRAKEARKRRPRKRTEKSGGAR